MSSDNTTSDGSKLFASQTLNPGNLFSYTFNLPGLYLYRCGVHPFQMIAQVNVTGPPVTPNPPSPAESLLVPIIIGGVIAVATVIVVLVYFHRRRKSDP